MNNLQPCWTDSEELNRFPPEAPEVEDDDPRTDMEKRLSWICDSWADAMEIDTCEAWADVRSEIYGASQALVYCSGRYADSNALEDLREIALENSLACIRAGRYEGAKQ